MPTIASSVLLAIGNTPLIRLTRVVPPGAADVLVKLESVNPTGSYKDRMALAMIEGAEARGALRPGMRVVEFTGGSTGSSLGMVCAAKGYPFVVLSSDAFSKEKLLTMTAFGAELRLVPSDGGKVTPALFERFRTELARLAVVKPHGPHASAGPLARVDERHGDAYTRQIVRGTQSRQTRSSYQDTHRRLPLQPECHV